MMVSPRRLSLVTGTAFVGIALICAMIGSGHAVAGDARGRARAAASQLDSISGHRPDSVRALSYAYLERARLGLGNPFRLVDEVAHDPRLDDSTRDMVAWAILDRVFQQGTYEIDASVLDAVGPRGAGADHLALIERVVRTAREPRIGEKTVRLAYGLAVAKGAISAAALPTIVEVTALVRDRVLAEADLGRATRRAGDDGLTLIDELVRQRAARELTVERPLLQALSASAQDEAITAVPRLVAEIASIRPDTSALALSSRSLLPMRLASTVARLGARRPPTAATRVTLQTRQSLLAGDSMLAPAVRRFLAAATNEETLVAAYAYADHFSGSRSIGSARVMVSAAVALRASAQEPVWFVGLPTPSAGEIAGRFGLRRIDFDRDVPTQWRPFYVRMVASALEDMRRVMPSYEPTGLTIRFVMHSLPDSALAMHDPRSHTLLLPVTTAAGTIGHELAHDLDWQSARRLFVRGGGYATDRSLHENRPLGTSVRGLAAAHAVNGSRTIPRASDRPAEVFARGTDWFVVDALAQMGRSNGYLSAVEDPLIPGYATSMADAASLAAAPALLSGLAEMTAIPDSIEAGYLERWQLVDRLDPAVVMARLRDAPVATRRGARAPVGISGTMNSLMVPPPSCVLDRLRQGSPRDQMIAWTIDAKAAGILARRARALPETNRPAWAHALMGDATWDPRAADDMLRRTTAAVLEGAGRARLIALPPPPFLPSC